MLLTTLLSAGESPLMLTNLTVGTHHFKIIIIYPRAVEGSTRPTHLTNYIARSIDSELVHFNILW